MQREINFIRELMESVLAKRSSWGNESYILGFLGWLEDDYETAFHHINKYSEYFSTKYGNSDAVTMINCYYLKGACYIKFGERDKARDALRKLKRFKNNCNIEFQIGQLERGIENMKNNGPQENKFKNISLNWNLVLSILIAKRVRT